jgi:hypothetical protein
LGIIYWLAQSLFVMFIPGVVLQLDTFVAMLLLLLLLLLLQALIPLKGAVDTAVCPAAAKAAIRDRIAALTKRCLEAAKAAAAANKEAAAAAAMAAADAAVEAGKAFVVLQLQVSSLSHQY